MRRAELVMALILALLSVYIMWKSGEPAWPGEPRFQNIWFIRGEGPGSGFWPFWLGAVMLLSTIWIIINWFRRASPAARSDEPFLDAYGRSMLIKVGGGVVVFTGLVHILGMYGAMFLFLIYYIRFLGRHSIWATLGVAVAAPIATFFFFEVAMRLVMPKGYLEPLFIPLYDIFL